MSKMRWNYFPRNNLRIENLCYNLYNKTDHRETTPLIEWVGRVIYQLQETSIREMEYEFFKTRVKIKYGESNPEVSMDLNDLERIMKSHLISMNNGNFLIEGTKLK